MNQRLATIGLWVLTVALALLLAGAGATKFTQAEMWTGLFTGWGYGAWFSYVIGILEILGAILLLRPKTAFYGAGLLIVVMVGAAGTLVLNPSEMTVLPPIVNLVGLSVVAWARRGDRWMPTAEDG